MDWDFAIERNRDPLLGFVMGLFAKIGLTEGGLVERLPRPVYRAVLVTLKAAESAVRRLIIVAARDIVVKPRPKRPAPAGLVRSGKGTFQSKSNSQGQGRKPRSPSFQLCDPEKRSDAGKVRRRRRRKAPNPAFMSSITIRGFGVPPGSASAG